MHLSNDSGSLDDTSRQGFMPKDHEIKANELYVLNGDVLIKMYHLIWSQRLSVLNILARIPPTSIAEAEEYITILRHINMTLYHILHGLPLASVLQMQELDSKLKADSADNHPSTMSLMDILKKYRLYMPGTKDETHPPKEENEQ